ncbi:MAG: tRNA uridine-5-carboxymethylaminomethyl(34) synthesis enzyme MnmG, partial [Verrucomicrobia bacterium]
NADIRLSPVGYAIGLLPEHHYRKVKAKEHAIGAEIARLEQTRYGSETLAQLLRRPEVSYKDLPLRSDSLLDELISQVEIAIKYAGYISRQETEIAKFKNLEDKQIPEGFDYSTVPSLRAEARQKFMKIQPRTLGQASRISGVSPSDIGILMVWLKRAGVEAVEK